MFLPTPISPLPHLNVFQSSSPISLTSSLSYLASRSIWELLVPFCSLPKFSCVFSFQELSQRYCQLNSLLPSSLCPHCSSPLVSFILPLQNGYGKDKANWELSSYHTPCRPLTVNITTALWQNKHSSVVWQSCPNNKESTACFVQVESLRILTHWYWDWYQTQK